MIPFLMVMCRRGGGGGLVLAGPPGPAGGGGDAVLTLWWPGVVGGARDLQALDSEQVYEIPFEDKFVPRKCSNELLIGVLRAVLVAQQKPDPSTVTLVEAVPGRRTGSGPPQRKRRRTERFNDGAGEGGEKVRSLSGIPRPGASPLA